MSPRKHERVLGIYPTRSGFAFAVVQLDHGLIDWGEAELSSNSDEVFVERILAQIYRSLPAAVAVEDVLNTLRERSARRRISLITSYLGERSVELRAVPRTLIVSSLGMNDAATKQQIADQLCIRFPEIAHLRPRTFAWKKDRRMNLFDAIALAVAGQAKRMPKRRRPPSEPPEGTRRNVSRSD